MNFDLVTADGTTPHRAAFESDTIKVWRIEDEEEFYVVEQPWKNESDGSRSAWTDLAEGVAWFKTANGHLGE